MHSDVNTINYLEAGLRAEGLRQKAIANNLANLNTPGFRRDAVRFESILAKAMESGGKVEAQDLEAELYEPKDTPVNANGNDVNLDVEVGEMVKNSLRHQTYMLLLKKRYAQIQEALRVP